MDTIIEIDADILKSPGTGILSVPMSCYTGGSVLKGLQSIDLTQFSELEAMTIQVFTSFIAHHVKENAIERLAHLGTEDIDKFLGDQE